MLDPRLLDDLATDVTLPFRRTARQGSLRRGPRLRRRRLRPSRGCPQGTPRPHAPRAAAQICLSCQSTGQSRGFGDALREVDRATRRRFYRVSSGPTRWKRRGLRSMDV